MELFKKFLSTAAGLVRCGVACSCRTDAGRSEDADRLTLKSSQTHDFSTYAFGTSRNRWETHK